MTVRYRGRVWAVVGSFWSHWLVRNDDGEEIYVDEADPEMTLL